MICADVYIDTRALSIREIEDLCFKLNADFDVDRQRIVLLTMRKVGGFQ